MTSLHPKVLFTGAAGYIGGSLLSDFLANPRLNVSKDDVVATVRTEEQAKAVAKSGAKVLQLDLGDRQAVLNAVVQNEISVIIHTATSIDTQAILNLIDGLSEQKKATGRQGYYIHTGASSAFYEATGFPSTAIKDTEVFEVEKELAESFPVRKTDTELIDHAEKQDVKSFIVVVPAVYGVGTGNWNRLSVVFPSWISASIRDKAVHKLEPRNAVPAVHISDLTALYMQIFDKITKGETIPSGKRGFYFGKAHDFESWETLDHIAGALKARGLIGDSKVEAWPSDEAAGNALGVPGMFVQALWNSRDNIVSEQAYQIGWQPKWDKARFLENIDDEVKGVLDHGKAKSSLFDTLHKHAENIGSQG